MGCLAGGVCGRDAGVPREVRACLCAVYCGTGSCLSGVVTRPVIMASRRAMLARSSLFSLASRCSSLAWSPGVSLPRGPSLSTARTCCASGRLVFGASSRLMLSSSPLGRAGAILLPLPIIGDGARRRASLWVGSPGLGGGTLGTRYRRMSGVGALVMSTPIRSRLSVLPLPALGPCSDGCELVSPLEVGGLTGEVPPAARVAESVLHTESFGLPLLAPLLVLAYRALRADLTTSSFAGRPGYWNSSSDDEFPLTPPPFFTLMLSSDCLIPFATSPPIRWQVLRLCCC